MESVTCTGLWRCVSPPLLVVSIPLLRPQQNTRPDV